VLHAAVISCVIDNAVSTGFTPSPRRTYNLDVKKVEAPRFNTHSFYQTLQPIPPHGYEPGSLYLERRIDEATGAALAAKGHKVDWWPEWGPEAGHVDIATVCAILADRRTGVLHAAHDPRRVSGAIAA